MSVVRVADVETTGLDPTKDRIVEIATVRVRLAEREIADCRSWLVNPGIPIPPEASAIHHLTDADVKDAPMWGSPGLDIDLQTTDLLVAHNAAFDKAFVEAPDHIPWVCTMRVAKHIWPDAPGFSNQVLRYWLDLNVSVDQPPHRALSDAIVTAHLLLRELAEIDESGEMREEDLVAELVHLTQTPVLLKKVAFEKHRDKTWREVPPDYLGWAIRQDFDEDVKHTIRRAREGVFA